ncbi:alkaline phosphatase family protein, partial [Streptomyces sp. NPDC059627]
RAPAGGRSTAELHPRLASGGGFRVPAIIISPWTVGGWVASEAFDHTSALQFLERFTGVEEPNVSDWRRRTFGDFTTAFRFRDARPRPPRLPHNTTEQLAKAQEEVATLPKPTLPQADQTYPRQEKGHRPHI